MSLAIVIPVYKADFFDEALRSVANQSDPRFTLYIGNDGSPYDIDSIVEKYKGRINLVYKKFDNNIGRVSLVKHWHRCIDMVGEEEWIWLFSDDDLMDKDAVASFFEMKLRKEDIYRFNLRIIDSEGRQLSEFFYPSSETNNSFLSNRLTYQYESVISNIIFSKATYIHFNGIREFDMAWGSDDALILEFSSRGTIQTIPGASVSWRSSGLNITPNTDKAVLGRKFNARVAFANWLLKEYKTLQLDWLPLKMQLTKWLYLFYMHEAQPTSSMARAGLLKKLPARMQLTIHLYHLRDQLAKVKRNFFNQQPAIEKR